jgi:transcriptional regulator with XRE-family HTH domain
MSNESKTNMELLNSHERLRTARERLGKSIEEMSVLVGMTFESYRDLENYNDEIMMCLSLYELVRLCEVLKIKPQELFSSEPKKQSESINLTGLMAKVKEYLHANSMTVPQFEDQVGWKIEPLLNDPNEIMGDNYSIDALKSICDAIGVNWMAALPEVNIHD